jgi:hypothetical protein
MRRFFHDRPWIWVIFAFIVLIIAWSLLLRVAIEKRPEAIPLPESAASTRHES